MQNSQAWMHAKGQADNGTGFLENHITSYENKWQLSKRPDGKWSSLDNYGLKYVAE